MLYVIRRMPAFALLPIVGVFLLGWGLPTRAGMAGDYDIGGGNNDFPDLVTAVDSLQAAGLDSAVTFNVYTGTYNGQVNLPGNIPGLGEANPLTIRNAPGESPVVTSISSHAFNFTGADYVTLQGLEITDCYRHGINNSYSGSDFSSHNHFLSNYIHDIGAGGNYAGIYLAQATDCLLLGNEISGAYYGVHIYDGRRNLVANNMITDIEYYGIRQYLGNDNSYYYNSVYGEPQAAFYRSSGTNTTVKNNIFYQTGSGSDYAYYLLGDLTTYPVNSNHNDLYAPDAILGYYISDLLTLEEFQAATGLDSNSISQDPGFIDPGTGDLHIITILPSPVDGAGIPVSITNDFDGDPRDPTSPDIGADEFSYQPLDYYVELNPEEAIAHVSPGDSADYLFIIANHGTENDTYDLSVTITGELWDHEIWNSDGTETIDSIAVLSMAVDSFLVRVSVPPGVHHGDVSYGEVVAASGSSARNILTDASRTLTIALVPVTLPYYEDFDSTDGVFEATGCWDWGDPSYTPGPPVSCSEPYCWGTNMTGNYPNNACCHLDSPPIVLDDPAALTFCHWYHMEGDDDGGNVKISTDGGASWNLLTPDGGYPYDSCYASCIHGEPNFSGSSGGWITDTFELIDYTGQTVIIRWTLGSDALGTTYAGWYVDNVNVEALDEWQVELEPEYQMEGLAAGDSCDYRLTVFNHGFYNDVYSLSVGEVPAGWVATFYDQTGTTVIDSVGPLEYGDTADFFIRLVSDTSASPGLYTAQVMADSRYGSRRNTLADTVTVAAYICPGIYNLPYYEDFNYAGEDPPCWSIVDGGSVQGSNGTWHAELIEENDYWMVADSRSEGPGATQDEELISPWFDCSGATLVFLEYWHLFNCRNGDSAQVDIRVGNSPWHNVVTHTIDTEGTTVHDVSSWAAGQDSVRLRFHYQSAYGWWWFVDNVGLYEDMLWADAATTCIRISPVGTSVNDGAVKQSGATYDVYATIQVSGNQVVDVAVSASDDYGWSSVDTLHNATGGTCQEILFPDTWTGLGAGQGNTMTVIASAEGDTIPANDVMAKSITVPYPIGDTLVVDDGVLSNAIYLLGFDNVIATKFTPTDFPAQINWIAVRLLGPSDHGWPWPDATVDQYRLTIWLENAFNPGYPIDPPLWTEVNMYSSYEAAGWAFVSPNTPIVILEGSFWVGFQNLANCASLGKEGLGLDETTDFPDQKWIRLNRVWQQYDPYTVPGDYMIRSNVTSMVLPAIDDLVISLQQGLDEVAHVALTWSPVSGAMQYNIYKSTEDWQTGYVLIDSTTEANYIDFNAVPTEGISFYYVTAKNIAIDAAGNAVRCPRHISRAVRRPRLTAPYQAVGEISGDGNAPNWLGAFGGRKLASPGAVGSSPEEQVQQMGTIETRRMPPER
jgi:parallel beta-helix repeat protein